MTRSLLIPREKWEWFGSPGHLIVANDCRFHLCTLVGQWLVSTVGEWLPDSSSWRNYAKAQGVVLEGRGDALRADFLEKVGFLDIGAGRKYETMVFPAGERCSRENCGCGMPTAAGWSEFDIDGYNDAGSATRGHYAMCKRWASKLKGSRPAWERT